MTDCMLPHQSPHKGHDVTFTNSPVNAQQVFMHMGTKVEFILTKHDSFFCARYKLDDPSSPYIFNISLKARSLKLCSCLIFNNCKVFINDSDNSWFNSIEIIIK